MFVGCCRYCRLLCVDSCLPLLGGDCWLLLLFSVVVACQCLFLFLASALVVVVRWLLFVVRCLLAGVSCCCLMVSLFVVVCW